MSSVAVFSNPLLDFVITLRDTQLLKKFGLSEDGQKQTSECEMQRIFKEAKNQNYVWSKTPGGAALNTCRILQWLNNENDNFITVFGAIGDDANGEYLAKFIVAMGITNSKRSLIANIDAAEYYSMKFVDDNFKSTLSKINLLYMEGFFLTKRSEVSRFVIDYCTSNKKIIAFNLNAIYVLETCFDDVLYILKRCKLVFGSGSEFKMLADLLNVPSVHDILDKLDGFQILVMTDGAKPVRCYTKENEYVYYIPKLKSHQIVDCTGCGDSFVAGFLHGYLQNMSLIKCVKWGTWCAQQIISQIGCNPPPTISSKDICNVK